MSSPMDFITECYYKESVETIKQVYVSLNKNSVNMEELLEGFKNMYHPIKLSKPKATRVQKELTEEEKCTAINKNGTQCKGKKLLTGKNPDFCSLHNNALLPKKSKVSVTSKQIPEVICDHIFTKGVNKGKQCIKPPMANDTKCRTHSEKELELSSSVPQPVKKQARPLKQEPIKQQIVEHEEETEYKEPEFSEHPVSDDDLGLDYHEDENDIVYGEEENFE